MTINSSLKTKWGNRFIIAAIIQGGIVTAMALVTVASQLLTTSVDIIEFLSLSFEGPAKWFFIGIILYLILIVAIAVTAVFYNHLEINLKKKFSRVSNILAWVHASPGLGSLLLILMHCSLSFENSLPKHEFSYCMDPSVKNILRLIALIWQ